MVAAFIWRLVALVALALRVVEMALLAPAVLLARLAKVLELFPA